jgi:hypothetical protein
MEEDVKQLCENTVDFITLQTNEVMVGGGPATAGVVMVGSFHVGIVWVLAS